MWKSENFLFEENCFAHRAVVSKDARCGY